MGIIEPVARQTLPDPQNPFGQLATCSKSSSAEPWQIFINHRGSDVKYTLATQIHHELQGMGYRTFLDVEAIEAGDGIPAEIEAAIKSASLHLAIFSPNYAESQWCLDELAFILKTDAEVIPIFYHVQPSDLTWVQQGKGIYAHAFSEHEKKGRYTQEKLNEWKEALRNISFFRGFLVTNNMDEAKVLKHVVTFALKVFKNNTICVAEHPIGLDDLVQGFNSVASQDKVKITGIVGMGGIGKTTLAKELFNRNFSSFDKCSFVADVRDAASRNALPDKQKKLLKDLDVHHLRFDSVEEGMSVLETRLSSDRALIVLDDVDHIDQLNALLPNKNNLGSQSMVIVTTRDKGVLESWGLSSCIYKMPLLDRSHSEQLFCWHAFNQPFPPGEFKTLVEEFLNACDGLPLSLKVFGRHLHQRSKDDWNSQLDKIKRILPGDVQKRLRISYDALDEEEKMMFLDIACFFIGKKESTAVATWDRMDLSGLHGLQTLVDKCLVELVPGYWGNSNIFREGRIRMRMHDNLRDMGREIASRQSPYRLWWLGQIHNLKNHWNNIFREERMRMHDNLRDMGREIASRQSPYRLWWPGQIHNLKNHLKKEMPIRGILTAATFLEELREDNVDPPLQLRELRIIKARTLQSLPRSIGRLKHLKMLSLKGASTLSSLPEEFCQLKFLQHLVLRGCYALSSLPNRFGDLVSLRHLDLSNCIRLRRLPESFKQLIHLKYLNFEGCVSLKKLPETFKQLIHLKYLNLDGCVSLESRDNMTNLKAVMHDHQRAKTHSPQRIQGILPNEIVERLEVRYDAPDKEEEEVVEDSSSIVAQSKFLLPNYLINDKRDEQGVVEDPVDLVLQCTALNSAGTTQIVGIGDVGGSGKTTVAKDIYKKISPMFSRSSFLYNIRDATEKELLLEKQKKLLCDLDVQGVSSDDVDAGKLILNSHLRSTSVLIVLDDVDNTDQLDALLPAKESLGKGSLIVATTRKPDVLKARDISIVYQMRGLKATDAKQLFCWHAFSQAFPLSGFGTLVERFLNVCNGRPLSLKVLGGMLCGDSSKDRWKHTLKKLSTVSDRGITGQLRVCFDALDEKDKEMFLDVACFFTGEKKRLAIDVWEGSGWDAQIGLDRLLTKCLVEVDDHDIIQMHDDLRDLGRDIAGHQSPYRLWSPHQLDSIPPQESFQIRGMTNRVSNAHHLHLWNENIIKPTNFEKQPQSSSLGLKLLVCSAQFLNEEVGELSRELLWLRWNDFNHINLPTWLSLQNLRVLELNGALNLQELWTDTEHAPLQLRELIIAGTWSASFEKFPNSISNLKLLKKIALLGGVSKEFSIKELPEEFCNLQSLEHLELRHCIFLSTLPTHFGKLRKLRHLDLYSCQMLRMLPISFKQLVNLEYLDLSGCKKLPFEPDILENMRKLKKLYFTGCPKLQELPLQIVEQKDLKELHLKKRTLKNVPENIGELSKLETLVIGSPHLTDFPESFRYLSSLIHLKIAGCINLNSFPESVNHLKLLEICIKSSGLRFLPQGFRQLSNLQILKIFDCPIGELDVGSGSSSSLPKLKVIHLTATDVTRLSISEDCCPSLETLQLELNRRLIKIDIFSTSVRMMKVSDCAMLSNINGISGPIKLETMEIIGCPKLSRDNTKAPLQSDVSTHLTGVE